MFALFNCYFFFASNNSFGQVESPLIPLKQVLDTIAAHHQVKFNYAEQDIASYSIQPPEAIMPLNAKLVYVANRTTLSYKITGSYIVIYKSEKPVFKKFCAYVIDEFGTTLESASVQISDSKNIVTGKDGYFELNTTLPEEIYVAHVGYERVTVKTTEYTGDCIKITLPIIALELKEIVAERYLTTGISKEKDGSFTITPEKFGILPGLTEPDVLLTMQQLPGITSIDETVSNINVRGGTHDQNLFMWNGIRLFQTGHFFGLISAINPNIANSITISKNGTSAFYGESVSSVVDISSRTKNITGGTTSIGTNMINIDFYTDAKISDKASIKLSARRAFTDMLDFPTYSKYSERIFQNTVVTELANSNDVNYKSDKEFHFYDFTAQYHQKIADKHDLYLHLIGIENDLDFTQGTIDVTNVVTTLSGLDQETFGGSLGWKTQWNENQDSRLDVYSSYYSVDGTDEDLTTNQLTEQQNKIYNSGFRFGHTTLLTSMYKFHSGYQFDYLEVVNTNKINEPSFIRNNKQTLRTHAVIGELEYNAEEQDIYVRSGIRFNYIQQLNELYVEPRLQFNYRINNAWQMEVLAELKSQTTSQVVEFQDDFLGLENKRWVLANNLDVPVQHSSRISGSIAYREKGWLVSVDNFYKKVNGITTYSQAFQNQLETVQATGNYSVYGTEFLVQKQFKNFYTWLSYTWNNNNYTFRNVEPQKFPSSFEISHIMNTAAIYEWQNFKVSLGSKWFTGRPTTNPLINIPVYDNDGNPSVFYEFPNSDNLDNFFQVNFSASYGIELDYDTHIQFGLSVLNIFNRKNIINRYYRINANDDIEIVDTFSVLRTPNALIKITF